MSRAFGKVILLGEHAVVYGQPALAGALNVGCTARIGSNPTGPCLSLGQSRFSAHDSNDGLSRALRATLEATGLSGAKLEIAVDFALPTAAGLGSSAALAVAMARAAFAYANKAPEASEFRALVDVIERIFHGNPSGLDALLAETGLLGLFTKAEGLRPIAVAKPVKLVIADSGVARSTQTQVAGVAVLRERLGRPIERTLEAIGDVARAGGEAIERGDLPRLGALMDVNQGLLSALSVSTPELEHLVGVARRAGAMGAKLTGAGGGGCVIALAPDREEAVAAALRPVAKTVLIAELAGRPG